MGRSVKEETRSDAASHDVVAALQGHASDRRSGTESSGLTKSSSAIEYCSLYAPASQLLAVLKMQRISSRIFWSNQHMQKKAVAIVKVSESWSKMAFPNSVPVLMSLA
jgi:hypothetical protein